MAKLIAIGGVPGTGKTTLVRDFLSQYSWERVKPAPLLDALYCEELDTYVLGKYEPGEVFAGTDRLSMAVQPNAKQWLQETSSNVLFEGDRLFNCSFLEFAKENTSFDIKVLVLNTDASLLPQRYSERGSNQSPTFLKGRATKVRKIESQFSELVVNMPSNNPEQRANIVAKVNQWLTN